MDKLRQFQSLAYGYCRGRCMREYGACDHLTQPSRGVRAGKHQPDVFPVVPFTQLFPNHYIQMIRTTYIPQPCVS